MNVVRTDNNVIIETSITDFMQTKIYLTSYDEKGVISPITVADEDKKCFTGNIVVKLSPYIYKAIANIAADNRVFKEEGLSDSTARKVSDDFLADVLQIAYQEDEFNLDDNEAKSVYNDIVLDEQIVLENVNLICDIKYILRAEVGVDKIKFYLIPQTLLKNPPDNADELPKETYVDSYAFTIPSHSSDSNDVSEEIYNQTLQTFQIGVIEKDEIDINGFGFVYPIKFGSIIDKFGYTYQELRDIYEKTLKLFEKFNFLKLDWDNNDKWYPRYIYGINHSENAIVVVDMDGVGIYEDRSIYTLQGKCKAYYIVGDLEWPLRVKFAEELPVFDIITDDDEDHKWTLDGPIRKEYIHSDADVPEPVCIHSWYDRSSIGLKKLTKEKAHIEE